MIASLEGTLDSIEGGKALLRCGHLVYEVLIAGVDRQRLAPGIGRHVTFHTLHYFEGQGQGTSFVPRLIGFTSPRDRAFFEVFTTVKGLGNRKALRALQVPFGDVAGAIARKDVDFLKALPEIGKRTAETIIAEIHGKVDPFIEDNSAGSTRGAAPDDPRRVAMNEAVAVLVSLGEQRLAAMQLIERIAEVDPTIDASDAFVAAAYRLKG